MKNKTTVTHAKSGDLTYKYSYQAIGTYPLSEYWCKLGSVENYLLFIVFYCLLLCDLGLLLDLPGNFPISKLLTKQSPHVAVSLMLHMRHSTNLIENKLFQYRKLISRKSPYHQSFLRDITAINGTLIIHLT